MRKINYEVANEIDRNATEVLTNKEIYNLSRKGCYECYWFENQFGTVNHSTSFADQVGYTVVYLDNWGSGELDTYMKIANYWVKVTKEQLKNLYINDEEKKEELVEMTSDEYTTLFAESDDFAQEEIEETFTEAIDNNNQEKLDALIGTLMYGIANKHREEKNYDMNGLVLYLAAWELILRKAGNMLNRDGIVDGIRDHYIEASDLDRETAKVKFDVNWTMAKAKLNSLCIAA